MATVVEVALGGRRARLMLALMTATYALNFVDRTIAAVGQAIKAD